MRLSVLLLLAGSGLCLASGARSLTYELPQESIPAELARADAEAVVANCSGCHSLDYISTQPRGKGIQFWRDAVNKMKTVYGASIAPDDVESLSTTLATHFDTAK